MALHVMLCYLSIRIEAQIVYVHAVKRKCAGLRKLKYGVHIGPRILTKICIRVRVRRYILHTLSFRDPMSTLFAK